MIRPMRPFPFACAAAALVFAAAPSAQEAEPRSGLVAMHQALLDAGNDVVVLNVAAHPDDESSRTNTMLRRKYGMRVVTAYSTYGDGGQNAIGREIGPELAHLRVRETLRAAAMMDVEVVWLGMPDFGFSKTLDETLRIWGEDRLLDAMRDVVDRVDPDVVITNHSLTQGHGHHRASMWAISKVLEERAAAGRFAPPLYARCAVEKAQLSLDPGELDPVRGETYARLAHRAWTQHVTQGPWRPHNPLQVGVDHWQVTLPAGVPTEVAADLTRWSRERPGGAGLPADFGRMPPAEQMTIAVARLREVREELRQVTADLHAPGAVRRATVLRRRADALQALVLAMVGVRTEVWLDADEVPVRGKGKGYVVVHGHERVQDLEVLGGGNAAEPAQLPAQATPFDDRPIRPAVPASGDPTARANGVEGGDPRSGAAGDGGATAGDRPEAPAIARAAANGRYQWSFDCDVESTDELGATPEPSFVDVEVRFAIDGTPFVVLDRLPYTPVPPIELAWDRDVLLVPKGQRTERLLSVSVKSYRAYDSNDAVRLQMGPGIQATATPSRLVLTEEHADARVLVRVTVDADAMTPDSGLAVGFRRDTARLPVRVVDVSVPPGMRIGLVRGPEDTTERTLADLGVDFTSLDRDALVTTRLEQFSALLLDIRAYHHRPELAEVRDRILQYCRAGGRVVAMYHKPNEWNERAGHPLLAPFALTVGNDRVTEEDAAVTFLLPTHRLLQYPHELSADDFAGWVQERGLNFPSSWDSAWTPLFRMQDSSDEKPLDGALLHTQYGRGDFVYCSLALYRQLRVGNPGAVRLLVNLLAK